MQYYTSKILDHYKNPRYRDMIKNASIVHEEKNHFCGDSLILEMRIENQIIKKIRFSGIGCIISQAVASMFSDTIVGLSIEKAEKIDKKNIFSLLDIHVGKQREKCALLALITLKNALKKYRKENKL